MITRIKLQSWCAALVLTIPFVPIAALGEGEDNPTGVSGIFNGNITTAGNYDPFTKNAMRIVDDIVVPGSVGAYPLKWTRYFNTRNTGGWSFSYGYGLFSFPDGRTIGGPNPLTDCRVGGLEDSPSQMADGGKVLFYSYQVCQPQIGCSPVYRPSTVIDPYGQTTTISDVLIGNDPTSGNPVYQVDKITEPGGRFLKLYWESTNVSDPRRGNIHRVEANDGQGNVTQWVNYTWVLWAPNSVYVLTHVDYSDGTAVNYTYAPAGGHPVLTTCDDVRHNGPMRRIEYGYVQGNGHNTDHLAAEINLDYTNRAVSSIATGSTGIQRIETRGDGATRTFNYGASTNSCPANAGKLISYTDFLGHPTNIGYDDGGTAGDNSPHWGFIKTVTDPNGHVTTYERQANSWGITKITHPDGSTIQQTFWPANGGDGQNSPWYLASRTDENGNRTDYTRDANNRITRKDYPADSNGIREYETFTYNNNFGQVLTYRMRNGAYQHFSYDGRGLLLAKTNPTWNSNHDSSLASDPQTTYTYYTSGPWTDRINQENDPRGLVTQFEYDHTFDTNSNETTTPAASRGLVTKIIHVSDNGTYQSFGYDKYGDKLWQQNELRKRTTYQYDWYGRDTTVTDPLQHVTTHNYQKPGTSSAAVTTFKEPFSTTLPAGETTNTSYDNNWRKITVTQVDGSTNPTTSFIYDSFSGYQSIGNVIATIDPNGNSTTYRYDNRDRKISVTDALGHGAGFGYDAVGNVTSITRPDSSVESKIYDSMNRVHTDTLPKSGTPSNVTESVTTTFNYYPGNATQMGGQLFQIIDGKGQTTTFQYDSAGMKTQMTYPNNTDYQSWTYDSDHNLIARRTVNGVSQLFGYDSRNRQISMTWSNAADWATFGYDDAARMTSARNPTSTVTRIYDDAGRMTDDKQQIQVEPVTAVSRKIHASAGAFDVTLPLTGTAGVECRLGQGTNHDQHQIIVIFPRAITFNNASITTGTATIAGTSLSPDNTRVTINLSGVTNAQTIVVKLSSVSDGTVTNDVNIGMGVLLGDTTGNGLVNSSDVAQVQSQSGQAVTTSNFREDVTVNGLINSSDVSVVQGQSGTGLANSPQLTQPGSTGPNIDVQYAYDSSSKDTRLYVTSAGYDYTFGYDAIGRFQTISPTGGSVFFQYGYDKASNVTDRTNKTSNGINQHYIIDALNRSQERDLVKSGTTVAYEKYGYDPQRPGLLTSVDREDAKHDAFGYDLLPELTSAQYGLPDSGGIAQRTVGYTWDKAGNRSTMVDTGGSSCAYQATNLNQYSTDGVNPMTNGSEHELAAYQGISYTYINDTHLSSITGNSSSYYPNYDALGRCVVRNLNGVISYYVYDGEKPILEYSSAYHLLAANLYGRGIDEILMRTDYSVTPNRTWYYQDDHEGSITQLTDANGNIVEWYRYDAFGNPTFFGSNYNNRFLFTGREYVATFDVYEYRNRAYHPGLGRFMSEDPKGFDAGDNNLFRYVGNDPLDRFDPSGEWAIFNWTPTGLVINLPISYNIGSGVPAGVNGSYFNSVISTFWSASYGEYNVTVKAYTPTDGSDSNHVNVSATGGGSDPHNWNLGEYMSFIAYLVAHEAGHLMGAPDLPNYADWPTVEDPCDIMNPSSVNKGGAYATSRDLRFIIQNGGSGLSGGAPGGTFQNGTWVPAGSPIGYISGRGTTISYVGVGGSWQATSSGGWNPTAYGQSLDPNAWYSDRPGSVGGTP